MDTSLTFLPGDIILTRGASWISRMIRRFSTSKGEDPTVVNHVGMVLSHGHNPIVMEALWKVKIHHLERAYGNSDTKITIYRMKGLSDSERMNLSDMVFKYANRPYGVMKIVPHFLDALIGHRYFFRRFVLIEDYPICSWLVAYAYRKVIGFEFGVPYRAAQPDDIYDFVTVSKAFECIYPLDFYRG